jgi:hypothetical protein
VSAPCLSKIHPLIWAKVFRQKFCKHFWFTLCMFNPSHPLFNHTNNIYKSWTPRCTAFFRRCSRSRVSPSMSVCIAFLVGSRQPPWLRVLVGAHCCNIVNRGNCRNTLLQHWTKIIVETHCSSNVDRVHCSHCCNSYLRYHVSFVIPLVALLTSTLVMWREEHLWYFIIRPREHLWYFIILPREHLWYFIIVPREHLWYFIICPREHLWYFIILPREHLWYFVILPREHLSNLVPSHPHLTSSSFDPTVCSQTLSVCVLPSAWQFQNLFKQVMLCIVPVGLKTALREDNNIADLNDISRHFPSLRSVLPVLNAKFSAYPISVSEQRGMQVATLGSCKEASCRSCEDVKLYAF